MLQSAFLRFVGVSTLLCIITFMIFCLCDLLERWQKRHREVQLVERMLSPVPVSRYQPVPPALRSARPSHPPQEPPQVPHLLPQTRESAPGNHPVVGGATAEAQTVWKMDPSCYFVPLKRFFLPDSEVFGKPPCYEEAVLMEHPPPPYTARPWPTPREAENAGFLAQPTQQRPATLV